jgi:GTP-binding protein
MMGRLDKMAVSYQIVLTKADAMKLAQQEAVLASTTAAIGTHSAAYPQPLLSSAKSSQGISNLRAAIAQLLTERRSSPTP